MNNTALLPALCSLILLFCTCGRAPRARTADPTLTGSVRYQEDSRLLETMLTLDPEPPKPPVVFNSPVPALTSAGPGNYKVRRAGVDFPQLFRMQIPCGEGQTVNCDLVFRFSPPMIDSLPATLRKGADNSFVSGRAALTEWESLVIFFEPKDRSTPRRLIVQGPTKTGTIRLPRKSLIDVPAGEYEVYLVKQQLAKDSTSALRHSIQTEYFTRARAVTVVD